MVYSAKMLISLFICYSFPTPLLMVYLELAFANWVDGYSFPTPLLMVYYWQSTIPKVMSYSFPTPLLMVYWLVCP